MGETPDSEVKQGSSPKEEERANGEADPIRASGSEGLVDKKICLQVRIKTIKERDQIYFTVGVLFILFTEYILLCQVSMPSISSLFKSLTAEINTFYAA
jgi:hypothetical protein